MNLLSDELRERFLNFFENKGHKIFPSDTLVPDDPTLLFTSAGMNQFKPYFLGEKKDVKRAVSSQKCLRTVDYENVGRTPFHHTFFEMLGNFSFGDYFKKEAIEFAWEFLTQDLNMKKDSLWISVYKEDKQAYKIWKEHIEVSPSKIVALDEDNNFWPANAPTLGPDGPCGPCSEIFFDKGKDKGCGRKGCGPACECGRFVEVWNLVFTQFNRSGVNNLLPLPQKNIDTGMGLERMACVLQGKESNFQIDILYPLVEFVREILRIKEENKETDSLINAIVDHARAAAFAVSDGVLPSNEKQGYVVRKLLRASLWKANILGAKNPFLYKLPRLCAEIMRQPYPEVYENKDSISKIILREEERFLATLKEGKRQLRNIINVCKRENNPTAPSEELFRLYDTHGFPLELSREMLKEHNIKVDEQGLEKLLKAQQELSRKRSMFDESIFAKRKPLFKDVSRFVGYDFYEIRSKVLRLVEEEKEKDVLKEGERGYIILDKTPFYPEGGGQVSDQGWIRAKEGEFLVEEAIKAGEAIVHKGKVIKGYIGHQEASASIDRERRQGLERAHTATHLLQAALRRILGKHISQEGSLVEEDRLHFDFSHFKSLTNEQLIKVEAVVNEFILRADSIEKKSVSLKQAKEEGALAFFKEKYQEEVRMVSISDYSKELCAGTHLDCTAEAGLFIILSESSQASGIRRIEALVGKKAYSYLNDLRQEYMQIGDILKSSPWGTKASLLKLIDDYKKDKKKTAKLEKELLFFKVEEILKHQSKAGGVNFLVYYLADKDYSSLLYLWDILKKRAGSIFAFLLSQHHCRDIFICAATDDLVVRGLSVTKFLSLYKDELSLRGGGRSNLVQGVIADKSGGFLKKAEEELHNFLNQ